MGFLSNIMEDVESRLVLALSEGRLSLLQRRESQLLALKASLDYRRTDLVHLVKEGFEYSKLKDLWWKKKTFTEGRFPGKYEITVKFPDNYPARHPTINAIPLFNVTKTRRVSPHLMAGSKEICIAEKHHGDPNTYWKANMNVKGALVLAYHVISDEIHKPKEKEIKRQTIPIKDTVYVELKKLVTREQFVNEFLSTKNTGCDASWKWGELAYAVTQLSAANRKALMTYYRKKRGEKSEKNQSNRTGRGKASRKT